jgi:hypothetical protein
MANLIHRWFLAHPQSVGEAYPEHFGVAFRVGFVMIAGGLACLIHALVPRLFERTGGGTIKRLYAEIVARQPGSERLAHEEPSWRPEYEI